jgi:hypothetical protein
MVRLDQVASGRRTSTGANQINRRDLTREVADQCKRVGPVGRRNVSADIKKVAIGRPSPSRRATATSSADL